VKGRAGESATTPATPATTSAASIIRFIKTMPPTKPPHCGANATTSRPHAGTTYTDEKVFNPKRLVVAELNHSPTHCTRTSQPPREMAQIKVLFIAIMRLGRDLGIAGHYQLVVTSP